MSRDPARTPSPPLPMNIKPKRVRIAPRETSFSRWRHQNKRKVYAIAHRLAPQRNPQLLFWLSREKPKNITTAAAYNCERICDTVTDHDLNRGMQRNWALENTKAKNKTGEELKGREKSNLAQAVSGVDDIGKEEENSNVR